MVNKNLFILVLVGMLLVSGISAFEIDDIKTYDSNKREYTIKNAFGLGETIATLKLNTPEIYKVGQGYQKVAEINLTNGESNYSDIIKGIELYQIVEGELIPFERQVDYKYKTYKTIPTYNEVCSLDLLNESFKGTDCNLVQDGTEEIEEWKDFAENSLIKNENITLGLFTEVKNGDYVEWIINVYGNERLTEWAIFTPALDVNLDASYPFNESTGTNADDWIGHDDNITFSNTENTDWTGVSIVLDGVDESGESANLESTLSGVAALTIAFNVQFNDTATADQYIMDDIFDGSFRSNYGYILDSNTDLSFIGESSGGSGLCNAFNTDIDGGLTFVDSTNYTIVGVINSSGIFHWINGEYTGTTACGATGTFTDADTDAAFGKQGRVGQEKYLNGSLGKISFWGDRSLTDAEAKEITGIINGSIFPNQVPQITLNSPIEAFNTTSVTITFNGTVLDDLNLTNVTLYIDGILNETNSSGINATDYIFSKDISDGDHNWTYEACDNESSCTIATTRNFTIDTNVPLVNITFPISIQDINLGITNETLNWTATDANLDKCFYDYNFTNTTVTCNVNTTSFILTTQRNITFWANDTSGNLNSSFRNFGYMLFQDNIIYTSTTTETTNESFIFVGIKNSTISSIGAVLWYAGTPYLSSTNIDGQNFNLTNYLEIPTNSTGNNSFFWQVTATGTFGTIDLNTTSLNQTVTNLTIFNCTSPSIDGLTLNFTTYDSATDLELNASFEGTFTYYAEGGSGDVVQEFNYQSIDENKSNWMFCLNSSGLNVTLDATVSYFADDYDRREYIFDDAIIGNFTQNIPLFLAATIDTDIVTITVKDQNYDPLIGALVTIQEWNVGTNTYSTIGMFTTSSIGDGIMNLVLYNIWYRAIVTYDGEIVEVTDVQKLADTSWPITVELEIDNPYDLFGTISHGLTFDNVTNITTFTWADSSGYTQEGCLEVKNFTTLGYVSVFSSCITSVAGIINYQIVGAGEYEATGTIELTSTYGISDIVDVLLIRLGTPSLVARVSPFGKVLSLIFIGTSSMIGIAAASPIWGVFLLMASIFFSNKLGWLNITNSIFWGLLSIAIIIIFRLSKRGT